MEYALGWVTESHYPTRNCPQGSQVGNRACGVRAGRFVLMLKMTTRKRCPRRLPPHAIELFQRRSGTDTRRDTAVGHRRENHLTVRPLLPVGVQKRSSSLIKWVGRARRQIGGANAYHPVVGCEWAESKEEPLRRLVFTIRTQSRRSGWKLSGSSVDSSVVVRLGVECECRAGLASSASYSWG